MKYNKNKNPNEEVVLKKEERKIKEEGKRDNN